MRTAARSVQGGSIVAALAVPAFAQTATVVEFPDPAFFFQNTTFAVAGDVGFVTSFDNDVLWSFSFTTGLLLDPDGLALPAPATASDGFLFANARLAIPGWFPGQGILVADVSDPLDLGTIGIISLPTTTNVQGQNVEVDPNGTIGYVASFPNDTLYSFDTSSLTLVDPDGLALPGNPDRIALAGDRLALVDTTNGRIMVADVSDPANLALAGVISLSPSASFNSDDNVVFAGDGRTGFVSSNERVLYSFDITTLSQLDPDGIVFGTQQSSLHIAIHDDVVACVYARGLVFIDVADPLDLSLLANANFGGTVAPQGSATVAFTPDGLGAAVPVVFPDHLVYTFEVATGDQIAPPFAVDEQPNYLVVDDDRTVAVICSGVDADNIWLIDGLFGLRGDVNGDGVVNVLDLLAVLAAWGPCPAPPTACPADVNGDGVVDVLDLLEVLTNWS